uniref:glycerol-3-phosphate 1-O-acyltransferase n=1 Tax=Solanum lycopersicum TaxID=4081 RepID=B2ZA20_SOLLC|nr:glycerol-3-phosphate acyltransferase protein [Solanum lycopersicum]
MLSSALSSSARIPRPLSSFSTCVPVVVTTVSSAATSTLFPISCFGVKSRTVGIRKLRCAVFCASKVRGMAEMIEDAMTVSASESHELPQSRDFLDARTGEDLLSAVRKAVEDEKLPLNVAEGMEELYQNYQNAVLQSGVPKADEAILYNMALVFDRVFVDVKFGQNYIRQLVEFQELLCWEYVGFIELGRNLTGIMCLLGICQFSVKWQRSLNRVIMLSSCQIIKVKPILRLLHSSLNQSSQILLRTLYMLLEIELLLILFASHSAWEGISCVFIRKNISMMTPNLLDEKESKHKKLEGDGFVLRGDQKLYGLLSWWKRLPALLQKNGIQPISCFRDRQHEEACTTCGVPGHIYPLAILCHDIMPPPAQVEKNIGEKRVVSFHGAGISVAPKIDFHEVAGALEDPEAKMVYTKAIYDSVSQQYNVLNSAIHGKQGLEASIPSVSLSQPWQ